MHMATSMESIIHLIQNNVQQKKCGNYNQYYCQQHKQQQQNITLQQVQQLQQLQELQQFQDKHLPATESLLSILGAQVTILAIVKSTKNNCHNSNSMSKFDHNSSNKNSDLNINANSKNCAMVNTLLASLTGQQNQIGSRDMDRGDGGNNDNNQNDNFNLSSNCNWNTNILASNNKNDINVIQTTVIQLRSVM